MLASLYGRQGRQAVERVPAGGSDPGGQAPRRGHRAIAVGHRDRRAAPVPRIRSSTRLGRGSEMKTEGLEAVYLETHNWGKSARFFQALGYDLEFETDHSSGLLRNRQGPYLFVAEVPEDQPTGIQLV